ncbi:MAG: hypothetical protein EBE86_031865 [Hormoscilla sp. GUM202]|nr:hypothetical protein [Hormoscilla sp. GUM202]
MERNPVVGDSGFVVALLNQRDSWHSEVAQVYAQQQQILLPQTVLTEVAYLIGRDAGVATVVAFLRGGISNPIGVEAQGNMPLQKAIGNQLARCDRKRIALTRYK